VPSPLSIPALTAELEQACPGASGIKSLKRSLRAAIKLEFATIPPYLTAQWSIQNGKDAVAVTIDEIVREEMGHMGLVCNMLVGLREFPDLATTAFVPVYPGPLPGGVNPSLMFGLRRLTPSQIKVFMDIEYPEGGPISLLAARTFETIGAFYAALRKAFKVVNPPLDKTHQRNVSASHVDVHELDTLKKVLDAIDVIRHQGEGSKKTPKVGDPNSELAHFYRFREVYVGSKYVYDPTTKTWGHTGPPVLMPVVRPMADIPKGGYQQADVSAAGWKLIKQFDETFTLMLKQLTLAWKDKNAPLGNGDPGDPIDTMRELRKPAQSLMDLKRSDNVSTYGPCFRLV
jgi:hypothetical protein